nr:MAG TPA: hypothetical protein [Caudoviricetes sp.]
MLTSESRYRYTGSLKTEHTAFNTPSACIFYAPLAWMRAENNQYQPKPLCSAFSESTPLLILKGDLLKKEHKMINAISVFTFKSTPIRTQIIDNHIWFCLIDVCDSLNLRRGSKVVDRLEETGVRKTSLSYTSGAKEVTFINEPNLYRLIFRSNKPAAVQFGNWVYEEVLPSIRKTGSYGTSTLDARTIGGIVKRCAVSAVREAITDIMTSAEQTNFFGDVKDEDLIRAIWGWYATHHKKTFDAVRELTTENNELKCKLETIRKAVR